MCRLTSSGSFARWQPVRRSTKAPSGGEEFHASGMSEDELGDLLEEAKHEMRRDAEPGKSNERGTAVRCFRLRDF